jgi:hypothetical protein
LDSFIPSGTFPCVVRADDSDSGGGGERVLWSAIAYLQRTQQDVVSLVYTGDFPSGGTDVDKERIINNVNVSYPAWKLMTRHASPSS